MSANTTATPLDIRAENGAASSAHQRLNIAINLENWRHLDEKIQDRLIWFHQHCLDEGLTLKQSGEAIDYDESVVFRVLKGNYEGSWTNITRAIDRYKRTVTGIQDSEFVRTPNTDLIWAGFDYAFANQSIALVTGESGLGKTISGEGWQDNHNHGRTVMVEPPPIGGAKALLRVLLHAIGSNKNLPQDLALEAIVRAFNPSRFLIIDEASRLLPADPRSNPVRLEIIRYIRDRSKCGIGLLATQRFGDTLSKLSYQFEQILGRVTPVRLFRKLDESQFLPIVQQYIRRPSARMRQTAGDLVNKETAGRIRILVETLKLASRIASKRREEMTEEHFFKAIALRRQMMGELHHAAK